MSFVNWSLIFSFVLDFSIIHLAGQAFFRSNIFPIRFIAIPVSNLAFSCKIVKKTGIFRKVKATEYCPFARP